MTLVKLVVVFSSLLIVLNADHSVEIDVDDGISKGIDIFSVDGELNRDSNALSSKSSELENDCKTTKKCKKRKGKCVAKGSCPTIEVAGCNGNCTCCQVDSPLETLANALSSLFEQQGYLSDQLLNLTQAIRGLDMKMDMSNAMQSGELLNITRAIRGLDMKMDNVSNAIQSGCPEGFFLLRSTWQCFKIYTDTKRSGLQAREHCASEGLLMPEPYDVLALQRYIVERYESKYVWLNARADGSVFRWESDNRAISSDRNPYWASTHPTGKVSSNHCLLLLSGVYELQKYPGEPFASYPCDATSYYAMCEVKMI
ncbi:unnamed protein product [Meganyctiphanes norvegica]|uniref:C-type lectin domain-containing protein n=1 Tax=Meganyctiphanes norvegica TaxID=48144 RepID=A0AAV2RDC3_MEGNR